MNRLYRKLRNSLQRQQAKQEYWIKQEMKRIRYYEELLGSDWKGKLLDLGCGLDYFSQACRLRGVVADGVDLDKCDLEKDVLPYPNESYDIITMHDVVEHVWDPRHMFEEINRVLKKGGLLVIQTHDWERSFKTFYDDPTRKRPYTEQTLRKIFMTFGMKIRKFDRKSDGLFWDKSIIVAVGQRVR